MRFVLAVHGTRGDVEPCAAVGMELQRRGHEVQMAVAPVQHREAGRGRFVDSDTMARLGASE